MNVIDLFAGCGGMSAGFERAGFIVSAAVEKDEWASQTYRANHLGTNVITGDITQLADPLSVVEAGTVVDGIIGGPPCQGFSLSGNRDPKDPRNSLFMEFVRFVKCFKPSFFVMENVTGILSAKTASSESVKCLIRQEFENAGYRVHICRLNTAEFGVPQTRVRVFFLGILNDLPIEASALEPKGSVFGDEQVTLWDAISDLPQINAGEGRGEQRYRVEPQNDYQRLMRGDETTVYNHIAMNHSARLVERFSHIGFGESVADVQQEFGQRKRGDASKISGKVYSQNNMRPYPDRPSPTVPASFQSNFIHPYLNRNFTAREGARLQSFPDSYIFYGKRTTMSWEKHLSQYQQIGNAVPPLLAQRIAEHIRDILNL